MAYRLRAAFESKTLRIACDPELRNDLRGLTREITDNGNVRFAGETEGSHCDRFWAKALRHEALGRQSGAEHWSGENEWQYEQGRGGERRERTCAAFASSSSSSSSSNAKPKSRKDRGRQEAQALRPTNFRFSFPAEQGMFRGALDA
jgi:hypothetical protein